MVYLQTRSANHFFNTLHNNDKKIINIYLSHVTCFINCYVMILKRHLLIDSVENYIKKKIQ